MMPPQSGMARPPLSERQQQLYAVLVTWQRSANAAELSREMERRAGMNYPVNDLLGALQKKGYVELVDGEWRVCDAA